MKGILHLKISFKSLILGKTWMGWGKVKKLQKPEDGLRGQGRQEAQEILGTQGKHGKQGGRDTETQGDRETADWAESFKKL